MASSGVLRCTRNRATFMYTSECWMMYCDALTWNIELSSRTFARSTLPKQEKIYSSQHLEIPKVYSMPQERQWLALQPSTAREIPTRKVREGWTRIPFLSWPCTFGWIEILHFRSNWNTGKANRIMFQYYTCHDVIKAASQWIWSNWPRGCDIAVIIQNRDRYGQFKD